MGEIGNGDALKLTVSVGDERSATDRRRLRGLSGLRNFVTSLPEAETTEAGVLGSVTEATRRLAGVPGVDAVMVDSAIYSAIRDKGSLQLLVEISPLRR